MPDPATVLIVKTSSLGDVVHTLPAVTDAARGIPGLRCDWLVERPFAEIPAWHPAVDRVIQCDVRGWRRNLRQTVFGGDWARFRAELRAAPYELVIDAQGLVKSALLARQARGPVVGPDRASAREPLATAFYQRSCAVPRHHAEHAVERTRRLFALALGYPYPATPPDAGLDRASFPAPELERPYAVLLHGTTWDSKRWPRAHWCELGQWLAARGLRVALPWGSEAERLDAQAIAAACGGLVLPKLASPRWPAGWRMRGCAWGGYRAGAPGGGAGDAAADAVWADLAAAHRAVGASQVWLTSGEDTSIDRERPNTVSVERVFQVLLGSHLSGPEAGSAFPPLPTCGERAG